MEEINYLTRRSSFTSYESLQKNEEMSLGRAQTFSSPAGSNKSGRLPQRANTTMARTATMRVESNANPAAGLVAKFNNVLKHFLKIDPEDIDGKQSGFGHATALIDQAWEEKQANLAVQFSASLLEREILHLAVDSLAPDSPPELVLESLKLIAASIFIPDIRKFICKQDNLQAVVSCFDSHVRHKNFEFRSSSLEILAACVKESDEVISKLIRLKAFDTVAAALERIDEPSVARFAAQFYSFSALASNTKHSIHERMSKLGCHHYLSIIQASSVDFAVFHASLALAVLAANKEPSINITFQNPLANEFLQIHHDFFKCEAFQIENSKRIAYGIAPPILERVNQLLYSNNGTIQAIGSFFLLQEVLARKAMRQFDVFTDTNNIAALKKCAASTLSGYARELASNCLRIMEIPIPVKLCPQVHMWDTDDVATWFEINGFKDFSATAVESCCDGRMLLLLNEDDLVQVFMMSNKFHRRKFIQDLVELRINGDYSSEDASGIQKWLSGIGREFSQYTFHLIQAGVDRNFLPHLNDEHLKIDCQITNGVHRTKILEAVRQNEAGDKTDDALEPKDVFVCAWKEGQLLSESLCAYLRLRRFSVATNWGLIPKSDEVTLRHETNIGHAGHFLLVLTPGCLENLIQNACEDENTLASDPFYRWIVTAFAKGCNIIPMVAPGWKWPLPDSVPEAIRDLCFMNGVRWRWGYQGEIISRLQRFMTDHGSLQSLTSVNRAQSKMSIASTTHGEYVLPTPAENLSRQASQRSITSVTSRPSLRSYGGSPQAETGSQQSARSRHSSRASVASQQSINEVEEEHAENGASLIGSPDKSPLRSSSRASSQASLTYRGAQKPPLPPSRSNSNASLSSSASQRYSRLADNTLGRASSRNSVASNRLSTASLPRPDMLRASSRSSVASGRSSVASDKPVPPPKPQSLSRASSKASLPPNSPNNATIGSSIPSSPTSPSTSMIFESVIQPTVLDKDPPQGLPVKEDEKMNVAELATGNSAAIVTTHAAVEPAPESLPSSPEPEPVSKKSVNIPVELEDSLQSSPEPESDAELEDHLQPVSTSQKEDANDPDDEPLDMLINKVEKDLKVQSSDSPPIDLTKTEDDSAPPSPEKVPEKAESLTAESLESTPPSDKKKSPQPQNDSTETSTDTPAGDALESDEESISEDSESEMTTVTQLTMSSTISNASAKLKKGISKRLGKAKTKTTKAFSKGLKGLKNSSEKLKSSLKRENKKKGQSEKDEEPEISSDDKKSEEAAPEVSVDKTGDNDKGVSDKVEIKIKEAPETEPDSGVVVEDPQALETLAEEVEKPVEQKTTSQPVVAEPESSADSKIDPENISESPKIVVEETESVEDSKTQPGVVSEASTEAIQERKSEEVAKESEPDSVESEKTLSEVTPPIQEAPEEPQTPETPEAGSISEAENNSKIAPENLKISETEVEKEAEEKSADENEAEVQITVDSKETTEAEPTVAQTLAQDFLTSEQTEEKNEQETEAQTSPQIIEQKKNPKKGGKKKNKKRKK